MLANGMAGAENVKGMTIAAIDPSQPVPDQFDLVCEWCGYSLVGLTIDRCPECGERFDPSALPLARVPWLFRRNQGVISAYLKTVWMIIRQPTAFAQGDLATGSTLCLRRAELQGDDHPPHT
jgi:hypothetical protein